MLRTNVLILTAIVSVLAAPASSKAGFMDPLGLGPGDKFHLAFVTDQSRDALSSNIADYNQFVNDQAAMSPILMGIEWFAIASTPTVNARDNAAVGLSAPVFLLDGTTKVADGFGDIWDGSLDAPINLNQFLATVSASVWTGSTVSGGSPPVGLGGPLGSASLPTLGASAAVSSAWILNLAFAAENSFPLYALSEELVVVPEPATGSLLLIGCGTLAWARRRRRPVGQSTS